MAYLGMGESTELPQEGAVEFYWKLFIGQI